LATIDPVQLLVHDHAEINYKVLRLGMSIAQLGRGDRPATAGSLVDAIADLRELLFFHFAREEEGLFPYAADVAPDLSAQIDAMAIAHDTICGAVARMHHLATQDGELSGLSVVFERFEKAYSEHSANEVAVLAKLDERLDAAQRARLTELVSGL
jgi:iron-sulfur cluster repair protein YtfE (RIC family)